MAYSVNWTTKIVHIPKADLVVVSVSPEVYELNALIFWQQIHAIQQEDGLSFVDIMRSNAPVTLGGVTFARSVEVINGYRVEFQNGAYQVNLSGANNNLLDARVQNNVSINASNSAGLINVSGGGSLTAAQVWQHLVEGTFSAEEILRLIAAALAGKISGGSTNTVTIRDVSDTKPRIVATVNSAGDRTALVLDKT